MVFEIIKIDSLSYKLTALIDGKKTEIGPVDLYEQVEKRLLNLIKNEVVRKDVVPVFESKKGKST